MASVQQKGNGWYCRFLYHGKRYTFTVGQVSQDEAEAKAAHVDYLLMRLKQKLVTVPPGIGIVDYVQFDGRSEGASEGKQPVTEKLGLEAFKDRYLKVFEQNLEATTIEGIKQHFSHLVHHLGPKFPIADLTLGDLQGYADKRAKANGLHGRRLSGATIAKELISLRTAWNWGTTMKLVSGKFPIKGISYPKTTEKPPFMTRAEIERKLEGATPAEQADLWDAMYLTVEEIDLLLTHVMNHAGQPFVYPMYCTLAHTGARRSEILRMKITDVDLQSRMIEITEKKRVRGKITTRRVPMSPSLYDVLKDWLRVHPGGTHLFCLSATVTNSKKRSPTTGHKSGKDRPTTTAGRKALVVARKQLTSSPLTPDEFRHHFEHAIQNSKWDKIKGGHVLRHSFVSALASKNVDQRLIDSFVGHCSEEMRRRYRHMYPNVQQNAIATVFG